METIGSHASVNYGAYVDIAMHGVSQHEYLDVVNFDHYNMIIGTLFMCSRKVILNFENDTVRVGHQMIPATNVLVLNTDDHVCWYHTTEKKNE